MQQTTNSLKKGNCLTDPSPRACGARQANHSNCSLNLSRLLQGGYLIPGIGTQLQSDRIPPQFFLTIEFPALYLSLSRD
jgi:hypothetical protein